MVPRSTPQLAVATNSSSYFTDASNYYASYKLSGTSVVFNWDSKIPALPVLAYQIAQNRPWLVTDGASGASFWQSEAEKVLDSVASHGQLPGGLLWVRSLYIPYPAYELG